MRFDLSIFDRPPLDADFLARMVADAATESAVRFERLMAYYRNDQRAGAALGSAVDASESSRPYVQAQEFGLPPRITGFRHDRYGAIFGGERIDAVRRKEVVIENDIAWRIDAMVHFLFGQEIRIQSMAADLELRQKIEDAIKAALEANGGMLLLQEMALLGHVYGFVDVLLRVNGPDAGGRNAAGADPARAASRIVLETIEADRAVPILSPDDCQATDYYVQHFRQGRNSLDGLGSPAAAAVTEILGPHAWQRYIDGELVGQGDNPLGRIPVVHVQNMAQPFCYEGVSEVDRLIPTQDELNTRLSDRANRISFQSFRMYLGRGIENFEDRPVAPGRMWSTDNPDASIQEFGGDSGSPSEDLHIAQTREAMDKISAVPSVAAGLIGGRIGNLTSAAALRVTLMPLLAKTARKRLTYGRGVEQIAELVLAWLDATGVLKTAPADRRIRIHWPPMLPEDQASKLNEALLKQQLGVDRGRILAELGYADAAGEMTNDE
ncbi:MAG: hypothetical protein BIFFINMI_02924 [Phycisphaerae bacterium]|nr:hypothetical protein [Phycisphaerae bacterium]